MVAFNFRYIQEGMEARENKKKVKMKITWMCDGKTWDFHKQVKMNNWHKCRKDNWAIFVYKIRWSPKEKHWLCWEHQCFIKSFLKALIWKMQVKTNLSWFFMPFKQFQNSFGYDCMWCLHTQGQHAWCTQIH